MSYKLKLELFEGPLDLLLYLVKKDHLNIYDIPIAQVTGQYMQYLELMQVLDLNIAGEFLVMAATLMQIKSKMLLPAQESAEQEEEDPRADLVKQLLEYERFKEIAEELRVRETSQREIFKRPKLEPREIPSETGEGTVYFEASIFDLITAFSTALKEVPKELFYEVIKEEFTIEAKIHTLLHVLLITPVIRLNDIFQKAKSKLEVIVTFLAILELIRLKEIVVFQRELFGEIEISRNSNNIVPYDAKESAENNGRE